MVVLEVCVDKLRERTLWLEVLTTPSLSEDAVLYREMSAQVIPFKLQLQ